MKGYLERFADVSQVFLVVISLDRGRVFARRVEVVVDGLLSCRGQVKKSTQGVLGSGFRP